jgi:hypothetical protein
MAQSNKALSKTPAPVTKVSQIRKMNRLKDEVYREMLLVEADRPGSEMGLALALLRAIVQSDCLSEYEDFGAWLKTVCPMGLQMIEASLGEGPKCHLKPA